MRNELTALSEFAALQQLDDLLARLGADERDRVLGWAIAKYKPNASTTAGGTITSNVSPIFSKSNAKATKSPKHAARPKSSTAPSANSKKIAPKLDKDLNLRPAGKASARSFCDEKKPSSIVAKGVVAVYYFRFVLDLSPITIDHIYTFFKDLGWKLPSDLANALQKAGSKGWLDTSDAHDIKITMRGENFVEHDLPS